MDKNEILKWSRKYDKTKGTKGWKEKELGAKFRKTKVMTLADLASVVEWKFQEAPEKMNRMLALVGKNDEATVARVSGQVFCVLSGEDAYRVNCLTMLTGVSPVLASVILTFFDPKTYGVFDVAVWRGLLGNEPPNLYTTANYLRLLGAMRKTAVKHNLDVRSVEKAFFQKDLDEKA